MTSPRPSSSRVAGLVAGALLVQGAPAARADEPWLISAEAPGAIPLSAPQSSWYGAGGMPAAAVYRALVPALLVGARLRGGLLSNGSPPGGGLMDPGLGSLETLSLSLRFRPLADHTDPRRGTGPWIELAGGGGFTGDQLRPTAELGIGWAWATGPINLGPSVRYLQVFQSANALSSADAKLALLGVELSFNDGEPAPAKLVEVAVAPKKRPRPPGDRDKDGILDPVDQCPDQPEDKDGFQDGDGCPDPDNDGDHIADVDDKCPDQPETVNGNQDDDGCPDDGLFVVVEDRIVLEERVLFDTDRARVKHAGKKVLAAIIAFWQQHPEYEKMVIEGHTDERGTEEYNLKLSQIRADRVKQALIELGADGDKVDPQAFGESKPRVQGHTEADWEKNRRVEFELIRHRQEPATSGQPGAQPAPATDGDKPAPATDGAKPAPATDGAKPAPDAAKPAPTETP